MSSDKTPVTPVVRNRRLSALSSSKVRSAFKSPCRSPNNTQCSSPNLPQKLTPSPASVPRSFGRKRRSALSNSFISPLKCKLSKPEITQGDINKLKEEIKVQEKKISELRSEGLDENELNIYIEKLHEYNEIKDTAQLVIGRLAIQLQTTTRELHTKFGLALED